VTSDIASSLGLERVRGAIITEIAPGGPAERAGFKAGDVVLSADGFDINQPSAFDFRLATRPLGSKVRIDYVRGGQPGSVDLLLEGAPGAGPDGTATLDGNTRFAGVTVETVNPAIAQELGLPFNARGVVVRSVADGSPAQRMGLESGDVILNLNGRDMTDAKTFRDMAAARPEAWQIVLQRGGRTFRSFVSG
jgi:serine protease Do